MQGNSGKCHLISSTDEPADIQVGESLIKINNREKLLGIRVDSKLDKQFILQVWTKASNKLRAIARVIPYLTIEKKRFHWVLFWLTINNTNINNVHETCIWLIYCDQRSSYEELLEKDDRFLFVKEMSKYWHWKCTKSKMAYFVK